MMKRNLLLGLCAGLICTSGMVQAMDATVTAFHDSIKNKVGLDTPDTRVKAALLAAATKLKAGEEKDTIAAEGRVLVMTDDAGNTPLIMACEFGSLEVVKFLVDVKKADVKIANGLTGDTPLHLASKNGDASIVEFLLGKGVSADVKNGDGWMPIHVACDEGKLEATKALVCCSKVISSSHRAK